MTTENTPPITSESVRCGHCGNIAPMLIICSGTRNEKDELVTFYFHWQVLLCSSCHRVNFIERTSNSEEEAIIYGNDEIEFRWRTECLYPLPRRSFHNLPDSVLHSYEEALKVFPVSPTSFAVMTGRTLEFLSKDRNAKGQTLAQMIDDLAKRGEVPQVLADMARSLKFFRNMGAHASALEVTKEDAIVLRDLCDTILEYVYEAPSMLKQVQERIAKLRSHELGEQT